MRRSLIASVLLVLLTAVIAVGEAQQPDQAGYTISVVGQVNMPGMFQVRADRTLYLLDTIALARGLTARADKKNIEITKDGVADKIVIDLSAVLSGKAPNVEIKAGDIEIPKTRDTRVKCGQSGMLSIVVEISLK